MLLWQMPVLTAPGVCCGKGKAIWCLGHGELNSLTSQGQEDSWDNGVEKIWVWEIQCKLKLIKHFLLLNLITVFQITVHFLENIWFSCPDSILKFDFLLYTPVFFISNHHILAQRTVLPPLRTWSGWAKIPKEKVPKRHLLQVWSHGCYSAVCVCMFSLHGASRTIAVPSAYLCRVAFKSLCCSTVTSRLMSLVT